MAEDLAPNFLDVIQRATRAPLDGALTDPHIVDAEVLCIGCNSPATRGDGRCAACATNKRLTKDIKDDAADRLARRALEYADLQFEAAKRATAKGDATPAQWALLHTRTVAPVEAKQSGGSHVTVQIGMILPGLPGAE